MKQLITDLKVAVVMINWNGEEDSRVCLDALKSQSVAPTIIVVDNGSSDNFSEFVKESHKDVVLLENSKNLGFNSGLSICLIEWKR